MAEWLKLDPAEFSKAEHKSLHGVDVEVYLSPYDIPEAVRGSYNKENRRFLIEFKYIGGDEPLETETDNRSGAILKIGRHSKRIYQIEIDMDSTKEKMIGLRLILPKVDRVLNKLAKDFSSTRHMGNYEVAKEILAKRADKIFSRQVAA
jgi:hypothetical protein